MAPPSLLHQGFGLQGLSPEQPHSVTGTWQCRLGKEEAPSQKGEISGGPRHVRGIGLLPFIEEVMVENRPPPASVPFLRPALVFLVI